LHDPDGNRISYGLATTDTVPIDALEARLQHVGLATCDPARLNAFYERTVGYQTSDQVLDGTETLCALFLRSDHEHHSLALFQAQENRIDHQCYEVANWNGIRDWGDHFAALRIAIQWGPGRHGPGNNLFLFVHDPDGNWVEFSAELEVVAPDRPVGIWAHEERTLNSWGQAFLRS
jgi:catechol 2,3-dioxygenase-like lactoylglutathione lyase family enzyme